MQAAKFTYFIADNRGVLIGSFGLIVILLYYLAVWARSGRDPAPGVIVTRYTPPDTMSPAVMRYITKMKYDDRTFASAVINMAVKGLLKIVEEYGEYTLQKKDGGNKPPAPEEDRIMKKLLGASGEITLETANHLKIKSAIDALRNYLDLTYEKIYFITNKRYFIIGLALTVVLLFLSGLWDAIDKGRLPFFLFISLWLSIWSVGVIALLSQVVNRWKNAFRNRQGKIVNTGGAVFLTLFAIPFVAGQFAGMAILGYSTSVLMIFFLLLASFINYLFYHLLKAPTRAGRNILDAIEGFKVFLSATEKERLNMLNPPAENSGAFRKISPLCPRPRYRAAVGRTICRYPFGRCRRGSESCICACLVHRRSVVVNDIRRLCLFPGKFVFRRDIVILCRPGFEFRQRWWRLIRWRRRWRRRWRLVTPGGCPGFFHRPSVDRRRIPINK